MKAKYIYLTTEQQEYLRDIVRKGTHNAHEINRARVLLMLDRTGKRIMSDIKELRNPLEFPYAVYTMAQG